MQIVPPQFNQEPNKDIVKLSWGVRISFDKIWKDTISFGKYDISQYDGGDLYAPEDNSDYLNFWDYYQYSDYTPRVINMEWSRELDFPYSVSAALADVTFNNTDDFFSPDKGSPIAEYVLPKRPIRLLAGYDSTNVQQFVGITQQSPELDEVKKTALFSAADFLTEIFAMNMNKVIAMENATTDVILSAIFDQFGLSPNSYSLPRGRNRVPFVFFDKEKNAGNAIREVMQAEGGQLWIDEQGIIRMEPRLPKRLDPVYVLDDENTLSLTQSGDQDIINSVKVTSVIRRVADFRDVFSDIRDTNDTAVINIGTRVVRANSSGAASLDLENPCLVIESPTLGEAPGKSWFTAVRADGTPVTSGVTVTGNYHSSSQYTIFVSNTNSFDVYIDQVYLWGRPALVVNTLRYLASDADSVEKYGIKQLGGQEGIDNDFFGSEANADSFAETIIDAYKDFNPTIEAQVVGNLALQQVMLLMYKHVE